MSETWNSSKQSSRQRSAIRAATVSSGSSSCLQRREFFLDVAHERVEVHARLAADRHDGVERVHQQRLAATDAAPEVDAARDLGRRDQPAQPRLARDAEAREFRHEAVEPLGGGALRGVRRTAPGGESPLERGADGLPGGRVQFPHAPILNPFASGFTTTRDDPARRAAASRRGRGDGGDERVPDQAPRS